MGRGEYLILLKTQRPLTASAKLPATASTFAGLCATSSAGIKARGLEGRGLRRTGRIQHRLDGAGDIST